MVKIVTLQNDYVRPWKMSPNFQQQTNFVRFQLILVVVHLEIDRIQVLGRVKRT